MQEIAEELRTGNSPISTEEGAKMSEVALVPGMNPEHLPIYRLEAEILKHPQVEMPVVHHFCNGLYARDLVIPKGTLLTGAVHKEESFFLIRSGLIAVTTENGPQLLGPGFLSVTKAGEKRAGVALTDVICTTFHPNPTNEIDPESLWDNLTMPPPEGILEIVENAYLTAKEGQK